MKKRSIFGNTWMLLCAIYLVLPLLLTVIYSVTSDWTSILPRGFTLKYYSEIFANGQFWMSILSGIVISIIPVIITCVFIILALYTTVVYQPKLEKYIEMLCMVPYTINGVLLATSVLATYAGSPTIFSNRIVMLVCIYCIGCLPVTFRGIRNNMYAVNVRQLIEAAEILGSSKLYAFIKVVVPCMVSGIMVSVLMCMAAIFGDFAIIKIIASAQYETAQSYLYNARNMPIQGTSAVVTILFIVTLALTLSVLFVQMRDKTKKAAVPVVEAVDDAKE